MSACLENIGCPLRCTSYWRDNHVTKWIFLCIGLAMAISGYYISSSLIILDVRQELYVVCSLFWGTAGVFLIACSLVMYVLSERRQFPDWEDENSIQPTTVDHVPVETVMM